MIFSKFWFMFCSTPTPTSDMTIAPFPFILPDKPAEKKTAKEANLQTAMNEAAEKDKSDANVSRVKII